MTILIVRLSALADIVHALPVLAAIRRARPEAHIDWLVEESYGSILAMATGLRRRIVVRGARRASTDSAESFARGWGYVQAMSFLRAQHYDVALDLQGLLKSAVWSRASGARRVVGFETSHLREPQAGAFYTERVTPPDASHVIQKNLSILAALGIEAMPVSLPLEPVGSSGTADAIANAGGHRGYIVINPGAAWPNKRWPAEQFGALASALQARTGLRSLVTWGPAEHSLADAVVHASNGAASAAPPGACGTSNRTGRSGRQLAVAAHAASQAKTHASIPISRVTAFIFSPAPSRPETP